MNWTRGGGRPKDKEGRKEGKRKDGGGANWNDTTLHFDNRIWWVCLTRQALTEPPAFTHSLKRLFTTRRVFSCSFTPPPLPPTPAPLAPTSLKTHTVLIFTVKSHILVVKSYLDEDYVVYNIILSVSISSKVYWVVESNYLYSSTELVLLSTLLLHLYI